MAREGRKDLARAAGCALAAAVLALFAACAGTPEAVPAGPERAFVRLGSGALAYAAADVAALRPVLEAAVPKLRSDRRLSGLVDRTRSAAVAFFPPGGEGRFRLEARGDYPRFRAWLSLTLSADWKRTGGPKPYWRSRSGLSLAFVGADAAVVSDGSPWAGDGGPEVPAAFGELSPSADLRAWLADPAAAMPLLLGAAGESLRLPVEGLAFSLERRGESYAAEVVAAAAGEREARSLAAAARVARLFLGNRSGSPLADLAARLLRSDVAAAGVFLKFRAEDLQAAELAALVPPLDGALLDPR